MRKSSQFLNYLVLIGIFCGWSVGISASSREVWSELTRRLQAKKTQREQDAARLGVTLPSQLPSAYDEPHAQPKAKPSSSSCRFAEFSNHENHEAQRAVPQSRQANVSSHDQLTTVSGEQPSFMPGAPRASESMPKRSSPHLSPERQKAIATAKALGVPEDRELGEFLAYFPAIEDPETTSLDSETTSKPSAARKSVCTPQVTFGSVVENDCKKLETPVVSRSMAESGAHKETEVIAASQLDDQKEHTYKSLGMMTNAVLTRRATLEKLLDTMQARSPWRKQQAQRYAVILPSERTVARATSSRTFEAETLSMSERLKQHLEKLSARRDLRVREAAKYGIELPSKRSAVSGCVGQTTSVHPHFTVYRPMPMPRSNTAGSLGN